MSSPKRRLLETSAQPAAPQPSMEPTGRAQKDTNYFKVYAPDAIRRELRIESIDVRPRISTAKYCLGILEERLPYDVRLALHARADREGRTVQEVVLQALAKDGVAEAAAHLPEKKKK